MIFLRRCFWLLVAAITMGRPCPADEKPQERIDAPPTPLWSFAWVSDMHIRAATAQYTADAMHYVDTQWKPDFVLFTGDNNGNPAPVDPKVSESRDLRRQRYLKQFLTEHLKTPYAIIPGDNWPEEFEKVFGPKQYSFDCGGLHFVLLAPDRVWSLPKHEGLSVFDTSTWDWVEQDLEGNRKRPTIVAIHEPVFPPTFLDAPQLREMLARYPNVIAVLQGHLHIDLHMNADGKAYLVAPSLQRPPTPGMKLVEVHATELVIRTASYDASKDRFKMQERLQRIEIPPALQGPEAIPAGSGFKMENYSALPAKPLAKDPSLAGRSGELVKNALRFLLPSN